MTNLFVNKILKNIPLQSFKAQVWFCSTTDSTRVSEAPDPGSIPGKTTPTKAHKVFFVSLLF